MTLAFHQLGTQLPASEPTWSQRAAIFRFLLVMARSHVIGFALTLIVVIWVASFSQHAVERSADRIDANNDAANTARIIEQNVERTATISTPR